MRRYLFFICFVFPAQLAAFTYPNTNIKITLLGKVDLREQGADAIVNAANAQLVNGGGVAGATFDAAGDELEAYITKTYPEGGATGKAYYTPAFNLGEAEKVRTGMNKFFTKTGAIKMIIHAVGPDCRDKQQNINTLADVYYNSLVVAHANKATSIAFPAISTGIYGCNKVESAKLAIAGITKWVQENPQSVLNDIRLIIWEDDYRKAIENALAALNAAPTIPVHHDLALLHHELMVIATK